MVQIIQLWLPVVLSGLGVFLASMVVWMLPHHRSDYGPLPDEEGARDVLRGTPPGRYNVPNVPSRAALQDPEFARKFEEGPLVFMTVVPKGLPRTGRSMVQWLIFALAVAGTVALVASRGLAPDAPSWRIFQVTAVTTWLAYGAGIVRESVWWGRPWSAAWKQLADALVYGVVTGAVFVWLWPA